MSCSRRHCWTISIAHSLRRRSISASARRPRRCSNIIRSSPNASSSTPRRRSGWRAPSAAARYDWVVDVQSSPRTAILTRLSGAPVRIGWRQRVWGAAYTHAVERVLDREYAVRARRRLLEAAGIAVGDTLPHLEITAAERANGEAALVAAGAPAGRPRIGMQLSTSERARNWPLRHFAALVRSLRDAALTPLVFDAPGDEERIAELRALAPEVVVAPRGLRRFLGMLAACDAFVSGNTGPAHMADALGVPRVTIFGATPALAWAPERPTVIALAGAKPPHADRRARARAASEGEEYSADVLPGARLRGRSLARRVTGGARRARIAAAAACVIGAPALAAQVEPPNTTCAGQTITAVTVLALPPLEHPSKDWWSTPVRIMNNTHSVTKASVVQSLMLLKPGDKCDRFLMRESERILRAQPFIADAHIAVVPDSSGTVLLVVSTQDEFTFIIATRLSGQSPFVTALTLGDGNIGGNGMSLAGSWVHTDSREGFGIAYTNYAILEHPWQLQLAAARGQVGEASYAGDMSHPFFSDAQRNAWRGSLADVTLLAPFQRADTTSFNMGQHRQFAFAGDAVRLGKPGAVLLLGGALSTEFDAASIPFVGFDSGVSYDSLLMRYVARRSVRANLIVQLRGIRFERATRLGTVNGYPGSPHRFRVRRRGGARFRQHRWLGSRPLPVEQDLRGRRRRTDVRLRAGDHGSAPRRLRRRVERCAGEREREALPAIRTDQHAHRRCRVRRRVADDAPLRAGSGPGGGRRARIRIVTRCRRRARRAQARGPLVPGEHHWTAPTWGSRCSPMWARCTPATSPSARPRPSRPASASGCSSRRRWDRGARTAWTSRCR